MYMPNILALERAQEGWSGVLDRLAYTVRALSQKKKKTDQDKQAKFPEDLEKGMEEELTVDGIGVR